MSGWLLQIQTIYWSAPTDNRQLSQCVWLTPTDPNNLLVCPNGQQAVEPVCLADSYRSKQSIGLPQRTTGSWASVSGWLLQIQTIYSKVKITQSMRAGGRLNSQCLGINIKERPCLDSWETDAGLREIKQPKINMQTLSSVYTHARGSKNGEQNSKYCVFLLNGYKNHGLGNRGLVNGDSTQLILTTSSLL